MRVSEPSRQSGFTLAGISIAILVVGTLVAVLGATLCKQAVDERVATQISDVRAALEDYSNQYGRYPPNCVDRTEVEQHILSVWPRIDQRELQDVARLLLDYMDPAEAIPFWLGGFSSDPKHPFSGAGGPLVTYSGEFYANPKRNRGLYSFQEASLSLEPVQILQRDPRVIGQRTDDPDGQTDSFPVFIPAGSKRPLVYVNSRSYGKVYLPAN